MQYISGVDMYVYHQVTTVEGGHSRKQMFKDFRNSLVPTGFSN